MSHALDKSALPKRVESVRVATTGVISPSGVLGTARQHPRWLCITI